MDRGQGKKGGIAVGKRGVGYVYQSDGECGRVHTVLVGLMLAEKEAIVIWVGCCWIGIGPPLSCHLSLSLNIWTQSIAIIIRDYHLFSL